MRPPRPTRGLPTSRAYWELKAEQMMNRVFAPNAAIDLDPVLDEPEGPTTVASPPHRPLPHAASGVRTTQIPPSAPAKNPGKQPRKVSALAVTLGAILGGVGLASALGAVVMMHQWTALQRTLSQERNLLLVERLRGLGPANAPQTVDTPPAPVLTPLASNDPRGLSSFDGLPPPPPEEPWMEQLSELPSSTQGRPSPLRVPLSPRLIDAAPAASRSRAAAPGTGAPRARSTGPLPQLVGLVGAPGRAGAAIFQVGDASMNISVGEQIGSSGWRLRAADAESALIEQGSEVRRISIVPGG